jgi:hypothetical protein
MHDCVKTRDLLVDLVFDEMGSEARRRALLELEGCPDCLAQYRSMTEALRVFDQATETAMPEESYWPGYETRLSERLRLERPSWARRLADWIGGLGMVTASPLPVAVGLALVLLAVGWWTWRRQQAVGSAEDPPAVAMETPTPRPKVESHGEVIARTPTPAEISERRPPVHPVAAKLNGKAPSVRREEQGGKIVEDIIVPSESDQSLITASLFTPETIKQT